MEGIEKLELNYQKAKNYYERLIARAEKNLTEKGIGSTEIKYLYRFDDIDVKLNKINVLTETQEAKWTYLESIGIEEKEIKNIIMWFESYRKNIDISIILEEGEENYETNYFAVIEDTGADYEYNRHYIIQKDEKDKDYIITYFDDTEEKIEENYKLSEEEKEEIKEKYGLAL